MEGRKGNELLYFVRSVMLESKGGIFKRCKVTSLWRLSQYSTTARFDDSPVSVAKLVECSDFSSEDVSLMRKITEMKTLSYEEGQIDSNIQDCMIFERNEPTQKKVLD